MTMALLLLQYSPIQLKLFDDVRERVHLPVPIHESNVQHSGSKPRQHHGQEHEDGIDKEREPRRRDDEPEEDEHAGEEHHELEPALRLSKAVPRHQRCEGLRDRLGGDVSEQSGVRICLRGGDEGRISG